MVTKAFSRFPTRPPHIHPPSLLLGDRNSAQEFHSGPFLKSRGAKTQTMTAPTQLQIKHQILQLECEGKTTLAVE
ncbi:hypothetical protein JZ751_004578, partial [Albula glossodonta]